MEYQKIINLLDDATNQLSKCRTRNWVEMNDESKGMIIVTLNLKCQWWDKTYVITVTHTYLLNEL